MFHTNIVKTTYRMQKRTRNCGSAFFEKTFALFLKKHLHFC